MRSETSKEFITSLGNKRRLEGVIIERSADSDSMSVTIRLEKDELIKGLDFLVEIGLLEKRRAR